MRQNNTDRWEMKRFILVTLLAALAGCQSMPSRLTKQEEDQFVSLARSALVASGVLSSDEVQKIGSSQPVVAYYFLARPLADYSLRWKLSDAEEIVVAGRGDILRLENAAVARRTIQSTRTPPAPALLRRAAAWFNKSSQTTRVFGFRA